MGKQLVDTQPNSKPPVVVSREEMMRQWQMAGENRQLLVHRMGRTPRAWVRTFGCQGNVADSEKIMGMLLNRHSRRTRRILSCTTPVPSVKMHRSDC